MPASSSIRLRIVLRAAGMPPSTKHGVQTLNLPLIRQLKMLTTLTMKSPQLQGCIYLQYLFRGSNNNSQQQPPTTPDGTLRRVAKLILDLDATRSRAEREYIGRAENLRVDITTALDAELALQLPTGQPEDFEQPASFIAVAEHTSYKRAMSGEQRDAWTLATKLEHASHISKGTWELVARKQWMQVVGSQWKFKLKRDKTGSFIKFKARLVARGDMQDMDWNSVFALTVRHTTLRIILALAVLLITKSSGWT